jgi:hypothetical protein
VYWLLLCQGQSDKVLLLKIKLTKTRKRPGRMLPSTHGLPW